MKGEPHNPRFFAYLSIFTFFMILLVTADNYAILFIGQPGPLDSILTARHYMQRRLETCHFVITSTA